VGRARVKVVRSRRVQAGGDESPVVSQLVAQAAEAEPALLLDLVGAVVLVVGLLLTVGWLVYLYR